MTFFTPPPIKRETPTRADEALEFVFDALGKVSGALGALGAIIYLLTGSTSPAMFVILFFLTPFVWGAVSLAIYYASAAIVLAAFCIIATPVALFASLCHKD